MGGAFYCTLLQKKDKAITLVFGVVYNKIHHSQGLYPTRTAHGIQPLGVVYFVVHHAKNMCNGIVSLTDVIKVHQLETLTFRQIVSGQDLTTWDSSTRLCLLLTSIIDDSLILNSLGHEARYRFSRVNYSRIHVAFS